MINEEWRPIPGFKDYYASDLGRIKRIRANGVHYILRHKIDKYGYPVVCICMDGREYSRTVHRLVALAWLSNPDKKLEVNHIDGNKTNCFLPNLEWCTADENRSYAVKMGFYKGYRKQVLDLCTGIFYDSIKEAYEVFPRDFGKTHFENMLRGERPNKTRYIVLK